MDELQPQHTHGKSRRHRIAQQLGVQLSWSSQCSSRNERHCLNKVEGELIPKSCLLTSVARMCMRTHTDNKESDLLNLLSEGSCALQSVAHFVWSSHEPCFPFSLHHPHYHHDHYRHVTTISITIITTAIIPTVTVCTIITITIAVVITLPLSLLPPPSLGHSYHYYYPHLCHHHRHHPFGHQHL